MKTPFFSILLSLFLLCANAQAPSSYKISFEEAVHHEAQIEATFSNLKKDEVIFRMSRSSPGRYALHEFAKNVFDVKVTDSNGNPLTITRPDPYSWKTSGHDGSIQVSYRLFANHGDGTYAQVDETHAHLNIPATFMYVPELMDQEIEVTFIPREDLNWKIATQLKPLEENTYYAKDLQYFMDSPTELSNFSRRSFVLDGETITLVLHHRGTEDEVDRYFEQVKKVVLQEKYVYGELPEFDYGEYTFLACYMPHVDGDGMEHRNSTVCTSTSDLSDQNSVGKISTIAHEFFHAWNIERIRPQALEPFNFEKANMSGELWFGEGFTSYYAGLILCRSQLMETETYVNWLTGSFNYVWNSSGRLFYSPIEMSYQAPFQDAAESVDQTNSRNTFISYYSYGHMLGLALDLSLREMGLNLDDFMKLVWKKYGKKAKYYTNKDLQQVLGEYAGDKFGDYFFNSFIYKAEMPDYEKLFNTVGIVLNTNPTTPVYGINFTDTILRGYPAFESPAYKAGLTKGDKILKIDDVPIISDSQLTELLKTYKPGDLLSIEFERYEKSSTTTLEVGSNPNFQLSLYEKAGLILEDSTKVNRTNWLAPKDH
ncbi:M61 family metallopeptidase [Eudoraea chungangensis]|uniref:M61 family metallopeptidase n=1 Tax=Eudoraea chungangensis TaxID=1481905 RepID=UPI0023EC1364|nr:PDZ domain-containing protein [Eudoraea chungangensis]